MVQNEDSRKRVATVDGIKATSLSIGGASDSGSNRLEKKPRREVEKPVLNDNENHTSTDPFIDAENKEIARLEKLMGIKGGAYVISLLYKNKYHECNVHSVLCREKW